MKSRFWSWGALLMCALGVTHDARAATFSVANTLDSGQGSLRQAIADANNTPGDDTITFNGSVFGSPQTITLTSGELLISSNVTLRGPDARLLSISGNNASRVFNIVGGVADISDVTIKDAYSIGRRASIGQSNGADRGGGIRNSGVLLLTNCTVSNNKVQSNIGDGPQTSFGAGLYNEGKAILGNCTFSGNVAGGGPPSPNNTLFPAPDNSQGGAIFNNSSGTLVLANCTLSGNSATFTGGGLVSSGNATLTNCTVVDNSSTAVVNGGTLTIGNTILSNSGATISSFRTVNDQGYNLTSDNGGADINGNNVVLTAPTDKRGVDPLLGPLAFNGGATPTRALMAGSPAIDAGNSTLPTDQRGVARPFDDPNIANAPGGNGGDIGSFERAPDTAQSSSTLLVTVPGDHDDGACGVQDCTLREAMNLANKQNNSATITFDPNVFSNSVQTIPLVAALPPVTSNMNIVAPSGGVTIAGQASFGILSIQGATLGLVNLGFVGPGPFAISNRGTLNLNRVGALGVGTGLYNFGTANVLGGVFSNNGTGINNSGTLQLAIAAFSGNTDALLNGAGATTNARNCLVSSNGNGFQNSGTLSLINSSFSFNGDALRNNGASALASFTQVTIAGNTNALLNNGGTLNVLSNTVSSNGGGLVNNSGTLNVRNTLSAGNGTNLAGTLNSNSFNLLSGTAGQAGLQTNSNGSPVLQDNGGAVQTIALAAGSAAINAGDPALPDGTDERGPGFPRVQKGRADIGAFESNLSASPASFSLVVTTTTDEDNGNINPTQGSGTSLREAIGAANLNGGGIISFDQSVFGSLQTITLNGSALPAITSDITVNGPSVGVGIEGRGIALLLPIQSGNVTLARLRLSGAGVGIHNKGTLSFGSGSLSNNGRGLLNVSGATATLSNSSVQNNGTGISNAGLVFADGTNGGGNTDFLINTGIASMGTCTLASNSNAIQNSGQVILVNSTIAFNGDGLRNMSGATSNQVQNTFVGNTNAILNASGAGVRIEACTITGNGGGLINNGGTMNVNSTLSVSNGQNVSGTLATNTFNLLTVTAQVAGLDTFSNGFPRLSANGGPTRTVALLSGSIALNAGDPNLSTGGDQRGSSRVVGGRPDIGAFEFGGSSASALRKSPAPKKSAPSAPSS